jgi:two-component system sensor histidine kinase BaeS
MRSSASTVAWTAAILTSALGAAILFSVEPGINWPIWVAAASASLILSRLVAVRRVETPLLVLVAWATVLSLGFALTDKPFYGLIVASDAMLLGLATITLGAEKWSDLSAKLLVAVPFLAPFRVVTTTAREVAEAPSSVSSPRTRSIIKGALLSVPLVIVLVALLGNADPVIRWSTDHMTAWLPDWSFGPRVLFFAFLLTLTLGANSIARRQLAAKFPQYPPLGVSPTIGLTEQRMMLWSAAVVLWLFVLLQASYLIHPPPAAVGTGVTFADFARRGFGELSFAATLVAGIILVLEYTRPADATERDRVVLRRLELALVIALEIVLISAFRRVILYEQAYGYTTARVFAQAYMIVMALSLAALALEITSGRISVAFGRRVAEIALGVFTVLVFWNFEAWIVNRNIDRAATTGKFDARYTRRLSRDAIPTLVQRRADIPVVQRDSVMIQLGCERLPAERRWFEWNSSVAAADRALRSVQTPPCPRRDSPVSRD